MLSVVPLLLNPIRLVPPVDISKLSAAELYIPVLVSPAPVPLLFPKLIPGLDTVPGLICILELFEVAEPSNSTVVTPPSFCI